MQVYSFPPAAVVEAVDVSIVADTGHSLPFYAYQSTHSIRKVYAEAVKGDHYRIVVRNNLNRRVGVVVAVDGRNIISGQQSWLKNSERMYILDPYQMNTRAGAQGRRGSTGSTSPTCPIPMPRPSPISPPWA